MPHCSVADSRRTRRYRAPVFEPLGRASAQADVALACANARRFSGPAYSSSYFVPQSDGLGMEVMELCLPLVAAGRWPAIWWPPIRCSDILAELVGQQLTRSQEVSFTEADGTRLAMHGSGAPRHARVHGAAAAGPAGQHAGAAHGQLARRARPVSQRADRAGHASCRSRWCRCWCCWRSDMRRRLRAERDLADALAFRKAMEDSLVTGLRARDLQGRITYVNPAFCQMVGFAPEELLGQQRAGALLAARAGGRIPAAPGDPPGRQQCAAARRLRVGLHAQGRHALSGADHRGAADQRAGRADRLDERLPGHQRAAPRRGALARQPGAPAGHRAAGHGRRDGLAAEPRAEPAAGRDLQLRHRLAEPAAGAAPARRHGHSSTCSWPCAASPSRPSAPAR